VLFAATGRAGVAVASEHLELIVNELGGSDLDWVLRFQVVRGGILSQPQGRRSSTLTNYLVLLFLQHDDFLLSLFG